MRAAMTLLFGLLWTSCCVSAEVYPSRPVQLIVPYATGGETSVLGLTIANGLSEVLGQPFVMENRPGASGMLGAGIVAKAKPDGYTLIQLGTSFTISPNIYASVPYDAVKDFTPIVQINSIPQMIGVSPTLHVKTINEFVALVRANPGKYNYGSPGPATTLEMYAELFKIATKTDIKEVPYNNNAQMYASLLGDHPEIHMIFASVPSLAPQIQNGVVPLAVTTKSGQRVPSLPDVPSFAEAGISGFGPEASIWYGLGGPAGMPKDVVETLRIAVQKVFAMPKVKERIAAQGGEVATGSTEAFSALVHSQLQSWKDVVESAHMPKQ